MHKTRDGAAIVHSTISISEEAVIHFAIFGVAETCYFAAVTSAIDVHVHTVDMHGFRHDQYTV